jgi:hypothetical protein
MAHPSATHQIGENAPLLQHDSHAQPPSALRSGSIFRWFFAALGNGGVAGIQGYYAVASFIAKNAVAGSIFGAGAVVCAGACGYCIYRVVIDLKHRNIQPIAPAADMTAAKADVQMLRLVHTRLNTLLSESTPDLEAGVTDVQLHGAISGQLQELEQILPQMRTELDELKQTIQEALANRSIESPSTAGVDSPSSEGFEQGLLGKLDAFSKKVSKDRSSRNASRHSSAPTSPGAVPFPASPGLSPVVKGTPVPRRLTFESSINGGPATSGEVKSPTHEKN